MRIGSIPTRLLILISGLLLLIIILVGSFFLYRGRVRSTPTQPIAFNHQVMVQIGIDCQFCHTDARRSPAAGMPSVEKCMGCHKVVNPNSPLVQQVAAYYNKGEPIPWARVNRLPRFVFFAHDVHVSQNIQCQTCHGDVGHMSADYPVVNMTMGWCLNCHDKQPNADQLKDCVICHR